VVLRRPTSLARLAQSLRETKTRLVAWRRGPEPRVLPLDAVRRRLELWLAALYGREISIEPLEPPPRRGMLARLVMPGQAATRSHAGIAQCDAQLMRLPPSLDASAGDAEALAHYRLLALQQAVRIVRGTALHTPGDDRPLERDLFLLREGVSVDAAIASTVRGLGERLQRERAAALAARVERRSARPLEREMEALLRRVLAAPAERPTAAVPASDDPAQSLAWAEGEAQRLRARGWARERYRALPPVALWGIVHPAVFDVADVTTVPETQRDGGEAGAGSDLTTRQRDPVLDTTRPPDVAQRWEGATREAANEQFAATRLAPSGATTDVEDERGEQSIRTDDPSRLHEDDAVSAPVDVGDPSDPAWRLRTLATVQYPEWSHRASRLLPRAVTVRVVRPPDGESEWAAHALREHAPLVRLVRHRFERLRARRTRLSAQRDGEELDVGACVRAIVERSAGGTDDDRLYVAVRPARRPIAILLLVDVSGSTDAPISKSLRIVDVERTALLLAGEALEAMGDAYAMVAFSGRGAHDVRVSTLKDFPERYGDAVRRRVSALEPRGNTRLGAAMRHATAMLARQPAGHRLLLLLSDGQPNDADGYQGDYGVEDSRQAVHEARAKGVFPFCLTVDREGPEYLPRIFGAAGHTILRHPEQLPTALLDVVKALVAE